LSYIRLTLYAAIDMSGNESRRAEFMQFILSSAAFQRSLARISGIASRVHDHAAPYAPPETHKFQFGQQWKFKDPQDSRFIPASVAEIKAHLEIAQDVELPEYSDSRFMGLSASTITAVRFTAAMGASIVDWRAESLQMIAQCAEELRPLSEQLLKEFAPSHIRCHHKPNTHVAFVELITRALRLSDAGLAYDLCVGMPAIGDIPNTGNWREKISVGRETFSAAENEEWNISLYADMQSSTPTPDESSDGYR
jgi:hypothetical protein